MKKYIDADGMRKYIDADVLKRNAKSLVDGVSIGRTLFEFVNALIESAPFADVRENVRGKWIMMDPDEFFLPFECSCCEMHSVNEYDFCPNCGADMRGEK